MKVNNKTRKKTEKASKKSQIFRKDLSQSNIKSRVPLLNSQIRQ